MILVIYRCRYCGQKYRTKEEAEACVITWGKPKKLPRFNPLDKVKIKIDGKEMIYTVHTYIYAKPKMLSAPAHTLIYLLYIKDDKGLLLTTARENELSPA